MSAAYVPQVGHKVRSRGWMKSPREVLAVGQLRFFWRTEDGLEGSSRIGDPGDWVQVVDPAPLPHQYFNLYRTGASAGCSSRCLADEFATPARIAVLHTWTDEHGDHAEIERVES